MKKRLTLCLFAAMLLLLPIPARASNTSSTFITAEPYIPDIKIEVVVPASGDVYINPYWLPLRVGASIENKQIVSNALAIENLSEVPLSVSVEVTGSIRGDLRLASESTAGKETTVKRAFMYFEILAVTNPNSVAWSNAYSEDKHVLIRESTRIKKNIITLGAADQAKRYGAFRISGDCVQNPREAWTEYDGVDIDVAFTFTPLPVGTTIP